MLTASCAGGSVDFVNDSNETVVIVRLGATGDAVYDEVPATGGMSVLTRWFDRCIDADLEARLEDGTVIDTRPGPFCPDDPAWVVTQHDVDRAHGGDG